MSSASKWNVPGTKEYRDSLPLDPILQSRNDQRLRGYWLARDLDGQLCFVSNQVNADHVTVGVDEDGTGTILYSDEATEFSYDGNNTIRVKRYS